MPTIRTVQTFTNANATNEVKLLGSEPEVIGKLPQGVNFNRHQIAIDAGDNTTGTIAYLATAVGGAGTEPVYESGSALTVNLATANEVLTRTVKDNSLESFSFTFASLGGSDNVTITISSWIE